jgi:hypothetical protein
LSTNADRINERILSAGGDSHFSQGYKINQAVSTAEKICSCMVKNL